MVFLQIFAKGYFNIMLVCSDTSVFTHFYHSFLILSEPLFDGANGGFCRSGIGLAGSLFLLLLFSAFLALDISQRKISGHIEATGRIVHVSFCHICSPLLFESEADFYSFIDHAHVAVADAAKVVHDTLLVDGCDLLQQHQ